MPTFTYFPADRHLQADWYRNMALNFPLVAGALGFSPADTAAWIADCIFAAYLLDGLAAPVAAFAQAVTGYVNTMVGGPVGTAVGLPAALAWPPADLPPAVPPGIDGRRQKTVDRIKKSATYTPLVIGKLLRTENTGSPFNPATSQGLIRSIHLDGQGRVVIAFSKLGGEIDGVNVYCQGPGETAPGHKLGLFTHTPALDATAVKVAGQPEERVYTVMNVINDAEVGTRSPAVTILVR